MKEFSEAHLYRIYDQGVDSIVRLVHRLTDKIEDLEARLFCQPDPVIASLSKELAQTKRTLARTDDALIRERQLNHQLLCRIRELEAEVERATPLERDSQNSHLPPSLDLPWQRVKPTHSLRKKSGRKPGGQPGHRRATLRQVAQPDQIIIHLPEVCLPCGAQLAGEHADRRCPSPGLRHLTGASLSDRTPC